MQPQQQRFQLVRKLTSQGACGTVFIARDTKTNNNVVVKQLPASDVRSSTERRVMRNLRHQNIVRFIDSWITIEEITPEQAQQQQAQQQGGAGAQQPIKTTKNGKVRVRTLNIAMEFVTGGDLRNAIRARRGTDGVGFPEPLIRKWLVQMCSALYYCHSQHILHRDLKSENILLDETFNTIKVADFGFAKELAQSDAFTTTRLGTPHSLPPEVYDATPYNNRADMWCIGIILYEVMTLARPFLGNTMQELFACIMKNEPQPAEVISKGRYSKELYDLGKRLLSKNPKLRPSAREILSFAWAAPLLKEVRLSPMTEEQRARDRAVWDRISVQAEYLRTTVMELFLPNTTVNVRDSPSFTQSKVVMQLHPGDFIEVVDEIIDVSGTRWLRTTRGFCIKATPMPPPRDMFRRIAEWRVRRPSSTATVGSSSSTRTTPIDAMGGSNNTTTSSNAGGSGGSPVAKLRTPAGSPVSNVQNNNNNANPQQTPNPNNQDRPTSLFGGGGTDQEAAIESQRIEEAAKKALETQMAADELEASKISSHNPSHQQENLASVFKLLNASLIQNGVHEDLLQDLVARYKDLAAPLDDMPWTIYCVDALRPLRLVPWVPVIRWVALITEQLLMTHQQQQQQQQQSQSQQQQQKSSPSSATSNHNSSNNNSKVDNSAASTNSAAHHNHHHQTSPKKSASDENNKGNNNSPNQHQVAAASG